MKDMFGNTVPGTEDADTTSGAPQLPPSVVAAPPPASPPTDTPPPGILNRGWSSVVGGLKSIDEALGFDTTPPPGGWQYSAPPDVAGSMRAVKNIADPLNEKIAQGAEALHLAAPGTADATAKQNQKYLADYNARFGDHPVAGAFKTAGEFGLTSAALGGLGSLASRAFSSVAPRVSDAVDILMGAKAPPAAGNIVVPAAQGAAQGAGGAALTTGGSDKPSGEQIASGATTGAWLGPLFHYGAQGLTALRGLTGGIQENLTNLAQKAVDMRIPVNWQKFTDNPAIRIIQDKFGGLPFSGAKPPSDTAGVQEIHNQLNNLVGESGPYITADKMNNAANNAEATMNGIAGRTTLKTDPTFEAGIANVENNARAAGDQGSAALNTIEQLRAQIANPNTGAGPGTMSGTDYRNWTQAKGGTFDQITGDGTSVSDKLVHQIEDHLDNLFHRSAAPGDAADLTDALTKYRIIKTLQPAVEQSAGTGVLNPGTLDSAVTRQSRRWDPSTGGIAYGQGNPALSKLTNLTDVYKTFFTPTKASQVGSEGRGLGAEAGTLGAGAALETGGRYLLDKPGIGLYTVPPALALNRAVQKLINSPITSQNIVQSSINPQVRQAAELQARLAANQLVRGATLSGIPQEVPPTAAGLLGY